jgi:RimJ/RimL family protein N-acetyltransferase
VNPEPAKPLPVTARPRDPVTLVGDLVLRRPRGADLATLYEWYLRCRDWPFFTEIAGPTPTLDAGEFARYCRDDSALRIIACDHEMVGYLLLTYIQPLIRVANLDFRLKTAYPATGSPQAQAIADGLRALCADEGIAKTHLLAMRSETDRLRFAHDLGFHVEGRLRRHFFHRGAMHDLVALGRGEDVAGTAAPAPVHGKRSHG